MSKIVRAVNVMISNSNGITTVISKQGEYFFLYDDKYKWSIRYNVAEDAYYLYYYPGEQSLQALASFEEWQTFDEFVTYSTKDLKTKEAYDSFSELYTLVKEKRYGIDAALDDIIGSGSEDDLPF
jgi:hypothetical protein